MLDEKGSRLHGRRDAPHDVLRRHAERLALDVRFTRGSDGLRCGSSKEGEEDRQAHDRAVCFGRKGHGGNPNQSNSGSMRPHFVVVDRLWRERGRPQLLPRAPGAAMSIRSGRSSALVSPLQAIPERAKAEQGGPEHGAGGGERDRRHTARDHG